MSLLTIVLVFLSLLLPTWSATSGSAKSRPEVISVRHGGVATDDRRCSRIGKDVLREGGNAVDVSIAAALCLGVVSPASSGIGGGAFMLVRLASGEAHAFDMRETAPLLASEMLNILSQYGNAFGVPDPLWIHREIESLKHVFAVRMNLGDPEFVNVTKVLADMLSPKFAKELKKTIYDNMTFDPSHYGGRWSQINDHGTSHLSIVDPQGNAVSMTSTVNGYFGAHILSSSTGIVLNNEMDDFSIPGNVSASPPPAPPNFIRPGKRPLSSMTPAIVLKDDQLKAVVGASGGALIIPATAEVLLNHFARGMDPLSSVMAPRAYHQLLPNVVRYENWTSVTGDHFEVPTQIRKSLQKKGHILEPLTSGAICQFIVHKAWTENEGTPEIVAVSDPRKGGVPAGF
ncbi:hypothetical protein DVH24_034898 [Malus domestica]|uniref:Gamma-glutamyl transferase n=1 Tax=Malus domestica TaxID=3750 RepID=A0A498IHI6_MALDO|nr:hypothetical protein DVH24_034898 [Malus domestica]